MLSRTENINRIINKHYDKVSSAGHCEYSEMGKENYYFPFWPLYTWLPDSKAYAIDAMKLLNLNSGEINVLDIGCGGGQFISAHDGENKHVYGISIDDKCVRKTSVSLVNNEIVTKKIPKHEKHFFGNAEQIYSITSISSRSYHFIFSRFTFMHLTDPLGTLQKAYALLADNGLLMVDMIILKGLSDPMPLLYFLHEQGYEFIASPQEKSCLETFQQTEISSVLSCFFIRKTKPSLELPLSYQECSLSKFRQSEHQTISYAYTGLVTQQSIDYKDPDFLLKIADNEWVQAYALQKILQVDPTLITNNPRFKPETGKKLLEEDIQKTFWIQISEKPRFANYFEMFVRADASLDKIMNLKVYCDKNESSQLEYSIPRPCNLIEFDCFGNKPIHLVVRLDNLEVFTYMIVRFPELLEEKTVGDYPKTTLEIAEQYNNYCEGTRIYKYLEGKGYYLKNSTSKSPLLSFSICNFNENKKLKNVEDDKNEIRKDCF